MSKKPPVKLTITAAIAVDGKIRPVGSTITVPDALARQLLNRRRAEIFEPAKVKGGGKPLTAAQKKAAEKAADDGDDGDDGDDTSGA